MKQILSIFLCLAMVLSLAACGSSDTQQTDATSETTTVTSANEDKSAGTSGGDSDDAGTSGSSLFDMMDEATTTEEATTTKAAETATTKKTETTTTTKKVEETTTEKEDTVVVPPAMDEVITKLTATDTSNDAGDLGVTYDGFDDTADVIACIEEYISVLEENYGYTLLDSEEIGSSYYLYYLDSSDSSLEYITYREHTCQMAIEGFANDNYGWKCVFLYYSPTIVGNYRSDGGAGSSDSGTDTTYTCTQCHGSGICQYCNGMGYTEEYYYLNGTRRSSEKRCTKCHGSGICGSCDGSGEREG